jgi:hypothetical protein
LDCCILQRICGKPAPAGGKTGRSGKAGHGHILRRLFMKKLYRYRELVEIFFENFMEIFRIYRLKMKKRERFAFGWVHPAVIFMFPGMFLGGCASSPMPVTSGIV